jgi:sacsin
VHVNGHFALDNHRRRLWTDTDGKGEKSKWNHFMNSCVLPPAYAALITEARDHLCDDKDDNQLSRYHDLFPKVSIDPSWKTLTTELYLYLGRTRAKVLPLLVPTETKSEPGGSIPQLSTCSFRTLSEDDPWAVDTLDNENVGTVDEFENLRKVDTSENPRAVDISKKPEHVHVTCTEWLSADKAYFKKSSLKDNFGHLLLRIGLPVLLHTPYAIYNQFKSADIPSHKITPKSVIVFLREMKFNLPEKLETSPIKCVPDLMMLVEYCVKDDDFGKNLAGLPLLLTQDGYLRKFNVREPVFCSKKFGGLFPAQPYLFVHSDIVEKIRSISIKSKENIIRKPTIQDIARLLPHVFPEKVLKAIDDDATWKFPAEGILSESWLKKFWNLLQNHTQPEPNKNVSLECLSEWPIIPTTDGKLVKVSDGKCVLDMTVTRMETNAQRNVHIFLRNLKCPVLNKEITFEDKNLPYAGGNIHDVNIDEDQSTTEKPEKRVLERKPAVTDAHVAHPHDVTDLLVVVNHMLITDRLDLTGIQEELIRNFLQFVQDNYKDKLILEEHSQMIKRFPMHKAFNGQFVNLIGQFSSCAFIPSGVPMKQLDELQERAKCFFLNSDALRTLEELYKALGVTAGQDITQFYVKYVFKHFSLFSRENQMQHLVYIKDDVHPSLPQGRSIEKDIFLESMAKIPCIPDKNGSLHKASEFFIPVNKLFKTMFKDDRDKFPPPPFHEKHWSPLLEDIGMHVDITPQLFLQFCTTVAENGARSPGNPQCHEQSKKLAKCLFAEKCLKKNDSFLSQVSQIKFIVPAKVEEGLISIHNQYLEKGYPPYMKFNNAVPWKFRFITWTTTPILPIWAQSELMNLRIAFTGPAYTNVLNHLENVIASCNLDSVDSGYLYNKVTKPIYQFLWKAMKCSGSSPNNGCSKVCADVGAHLKNVPCIFLQEKKIFVKGEQLVFNQPNNCDLKPFLYPVPRQLGDLEHFLKRLGATEKPTPFQIARVLKCIHDKIGEERITEHDTQVRCAMYVLFELLYKGESSDGIEELYLPTQEKTLVISCEMVCKVPPCYTKWIRNLERPILLRFEECSLKNDADDYIDVLPKRLRPTKFDDLFREDVAPESKSSRCHEAEDGFICKSQERYEKLLRSDEFQKGLERLLQVEDSQAPKTFEHKIRRLQTGVETKCTGMDNIKINIVSCDTNEVMEKLEKRCYAVQDDKSWTLYIQHELTDSKTLPFLANCVNKILGNCIHKEAGLIAMLGCTDPREISEALFELQIPEALSEAGAEFIPPEDNLLSEWDSGFSRYHHGGDPVGVNPGVHHGGGKCSR